MEKKIILTIDDFITTYESTNGRKFTDEQKEMFRFAYNLGVDDGKQQGKQEMLDFLDS
jgi:hypothetical protein